MSRGKVQCSAVQCGARWNEQQSESQYISLTVMYFSKQMMHWNGTEWHGMLSCCWYSSLPDIFYSALSVQADSMPYVGINKWHTLIALCWFLLQRSVTVVGLFLNARRCCFHCSGCIVWLCSMVLFVGSDPHNLMYGLNETLVVRYGWVYTWI
jgi:hypothetical protein